MELVQQKLGYRRVYLILQIPQAYWDNVTVFLLFNFFAMVGNFVAAFVSWPGPRFYWILVFGRLLFIPFFMFCNYLPTQRYPLPVLICNDWIYLIGAIIFAFLAGYLSSLGLMFNPRYFIQFDIDNLVYKSFQRENISKLCTPDRHGKFCSLYVIKKT